MMHICSAPQTAKVLRRGEANVLVLHRVVLPVWVGVLCMIAQ